MEPDPQRKKAGEERMPGGTAQQDTKKREAIQRGIREGGQRESSR